MNTLAAKLITITIGCMDTLYEQMNAWRSQRRLGNRENKKKDLNGKVKSRQNNRLGKTSRRRKWGDNEKGGLGRRSASRKG
jgi:hypothetical protein